MREEPFLGMIRHDRISRGLFFFDDPMLYLITATMKSKKG